MNYVLNPRLGDLSSSGQDNYVITESLGERQFGLRVTCVRLTTLQARIKVSLAIYVLRAQEVDEFVSVNWKLRFDLKTNIRVGTTFVIEIRFIPVPYA